MKKILILIMITSSLFAGEEINDWFNKKFETYLPYLKYTFNKGSYGVINTRIIVVNKNNQKIDTHVITFDGSIGEYYTLKHCYPDIVISEETGKYSLKYDEMCSKRFSLESYKKIVNNYMHNLSKVVSNIVNLSYNEPTKKKFIVIHE